MKMTGWGQTDMSTFQWDFYQLPKVVINQAGECKIVSEEKRRLW